MLCTHVIFPTILMLFWLHSFSILDKFLVASQLWKWRALSKMSGLFRGTWHDIALHYPTLHYITLPYPTLSCLPLPYLALPCLTLPYLALPYRALPCRALPCRALLHCTALHYTILSCNKSYETNGTMPLSQNRSDSNTPWWFRLGSRQNKCTTRSLQRVQYSFIEHPNVALGLLDHPHPK